VGRVYMMTKEEVEDALNVMTGNFSIKTYPVEVLFDYGAIHSFIYAKLVSEIHRTLTSRHSMFSILFLMGRW